MNTPKSLIHILYTENSERDEFSKTIDIIKDLSSFNCYLHRSPDEFKTAIQSNSPNQITIVILHLNSKRDGEIFWRDIYYEVKAQNKFTEVIVIVSDEEKKISISAKDVLSSGCFAFFQYPHEPEVLLGYILAAQDKAKERQNRIFFSETLNISKDLSSVVNVVAEQLKELTTADNVMLVYLKESSNKQGYLPKILYPPIDIIGARKKIRPTKNDPLIDNILEGNIKRRIFPHPQSDEEIKHYWSAKKRNENIKSWIALPLNHDDKLIGIILLDSYTEKHFNYGKINEAALEQLANQAATAIRLAEKEDAYKKLEEALKSLNESETYEGVLQGLAKEACKMVGGLFSYIVVPNEKKDWLHFVAAWSNNHHEKYIDELIRELSFKNSGNRSLESGFQIIGEESKGITTKAYLESDTQLLNCISGKEYYKYEEEDPDARKKYFKFLYRYLDENGEEQVLLPESDIAIPIIGSDKEVLGVINVEHELPFAFTNEHIDVLKRLADFAAIAIKKELTIKREKQEKKLLQDFIGFSDFSISYEEDALDKLSYSERIKTFLDGLANQVLNISKADYVSVFSVKDNISFCVGKATNFPSRSTSGITSGARPNDPLNYGHTFWCIEHKSKVVIYDTKKYKTSIESFEDPYGNQYKRTGDNSYIEINKRVDESINALVCIPMLDLSNNAIGVIWMHHRANPKYNTDELDYFQKYANKAANALRLAETIYFKDIEILIGGHHPKEVVLSEIVNLAKDFFDIKGVSIYETNTKRTELTRVATTMSDIFPVGETINYGEGLAGNLIKGQDLDYYDYSSGYIFISDYQKYGHPLKKLTPRQKEKLGSVVGIRFPFDGKAEEAIGVLVFFESLERKRNFKESSQKLTQLANLAGRYLQRFPRVNNLPIETENKNGNLPSLSPTSTTTIIYGDNISVNNSGENGKIDISNLVNKNNGLSGDEVRALFKDVLIQLEKSSIPTNQKEDALASARGIQDELVKGEKADEYKLEIFFRNLLNMAPDIFEVAVAAAIDPRLAASLIAQKVIKKIKSGM